MIFLHVCFRIIIIQTLILPLDDITGNKRGWYWELRYHPPYQMVIFQSLEAFQCGFRFSVKAFSPKKRQQLYQMLQESPRLPKYSPLSEVLQTLFPE